MLKPCLTSWIMQKYLQSLIKSNSIPISSSRSLSPTFSALTSWDSHPLDQLQGQGDADTKAGLLLNKRYSNNWLLSTTNQFTRLLCDGASREGMSWFPKRALLVVWRRTLTQLISVWMQKIWSELRRLIAISEDRTARTENLWISFLFSIDYWLRHSVILD